MSEQSRTRAAPSAATTATTARPSLVTGEDGLARCAWSAADAEYRRYHDEEWGRALRDDRALFEKICLEGFQAGLSWITILRRRGAFREAFGEFDIEQVAAMTEVDVTRLLGDERIIRHRGKIEAAIGNARATLALETSLTELVWGFAPENTGPEKTGPENADPENTGPGHTARARPRTLGEIPAVTAESTALSAELRRRGYRFVGPTTMYALMQSAGLVDDHVEGCHRANGT